MGGYSLVPLFKIRSIHCGPKSTEGIANAEYGAVWVLMHMGVTFRVPHPEPEWPWVITVQVPQTGQGFVGRVIYRKAILIEY